MTAHHRPASRALAPSLLFGAVLLVLCAPPCSADSEVVVLSDGFEGSFPGQWQLWKPVTAPNTTWGHSGYRKASGSYSAWCAAGGGNPQPAGGSYVANMQTWLYYGPFSLADATDAQMEFDLWLAAEVNHDLVEWTISVDDTTYYGPQRSASTSGFEHITFDFKDITEITAIGKSQVWVAFIFKSDSSQQSEGAYIDNVVIKKTVAGSCTYSLSPASATAPAIAGTGTLVVTASSSTCQWTAVSNSTWLTVNPTSGTGTATLGYSFQANPGGQRFGTLTVAGKPFILTQAGSTGYALTVGKLGSGAGTISSSPRGIDCGSTCVASFAPGTTVTLTAAAATGSAFAGWGGDCSGMGSCLVTMSQARNVTATFNALATCTLSCRALASPTSGAAPLAVAFTGSATPSNCYGSVGYDWDFGDGSAHATLQSPTHTYAGTGSFTWTMTASIAGQSCQKTGAVLVSPAPLDRSWWLPVVSHAGGAAGSQWRTDLGLLNTSTSLTAHAELRLYGGSSPIVQKTDVGPGVQATLDDVVGQLGYSGSGALEVRADQPLYVTSRTYNQSASGTFGQGYESLQATQGAGAGETVYLPQLTENQAYRTNIAVTDTGAASSSAKVELWSGANQKLGDYQVDLTPGQWKQESQPFFKKAGQSNLASGWARITVLTGSGIVAYASVIDNATNDPTTISMKRAPAGQGTTWVPVVAHGAGAGGSQWRSDVGILNVGAATATLQLRLHGSTSTSTQALSLDPGRQAIQTDIATLFGTTGSASLEVVSDQAVIVTSRTYNQSPTGTFGQDYDGVSVLQGAAAGQLFYLPQLTEAPAYRTNIGLTNSGPADAAATVGLFNGAGQKLTEYQVALGPGEWKQETAPFRAKAGQANMTRGYARVTVTAGAGVIGYASIIDNVTNDPTTVQAKIEGQPSCFVALSPTARSMPAGGGTGAIAVTAPTGCAWSATSGAAWITVTSGASGTGSGTVGYRVAANTGSARIGTLTVTGRTFTVTQAGQACSFSLSTTAASFAAAGGTGSVGVTTAAGCAWSATSSAGWITITSGASGNGNGTVSYSVAANSASARSGTLTVAGQTVTVSQTGLGCASSVSPTSAQVAAEGGTGTVSVTAPAGCAWTAASNVAWVTVTSGASGSGNGTVGYSVGANGAPGTRTGTLTIAERLVSLTQAGAAAAEVTLTLPGNVPLVLVRIPGGTFTMGSPDGERGHLGNESPQHQVTLASDYYLGKTEVTQRQWAAVMGSSPVSGCENRGVGDSYPVYCVSWNDITGGGGFIEKANLATSTTSLRLPTEEEWERAARAETTTPFSFGDDTSCSITECTPCALFDQYMWWCGNSTPAGHRPVGQKLPNAYGLYDMHGNVYEWTEDLAAGYQATAQGGVHEESTSWYRVIRGGDSSSAAKNARSASRAGELPDHRQPYLGFRLAMAITPINVPADVVGAWQGAATCTSSSGTFTLEYGWFVCPQGRLRGYEKLDGHDFLDCGTWSLSGITLTGAYKFTSVEDPSYTGDDSQQLVYSSSRDTLTLSTQCPAKLRRLSGSLTEDDCTSNKCSGGGPIVGCGTDCDCGHCWYCDGGTCRYGGEGPYGCYRGCPF
jgi:formylglycine-generating enzyme required for sulfatase activity